MVAKMGIVRLKANPASKFCEMSANQLWLKLEFDNEESYLTELCDYFFWTRLKYMIETVSN